MIFFSRKLHITDTVMIVHLDEKRGQWDCINDDEAEEEELDDGGIWLG